MNVGAGRCGEEARRGIGGRRGVVMWGDECGCREMWGDVGLVGGEVWWWGEMGGRCGDRKGGRGKWGRGEVGEQTISMSSGSTL